MPRSGNSHYKHHTMIQKKSYKKSRKLGHAKAEAKTP